MNALVSASARFVITPDRALWAASPSLTYGFWRRYLEVYDEVRLLVRAKPLAEPPDGFVLASGPGLDPISAPYYEGPYEFLLRLRDLRRTIRFALMEAQAVHLRLPDVIGGLVWEEIHKSRQPYGVEMVSDPYDVFAPGSVKHLLRPFFRWYFTRRLRRQATEAAAVSYVTAEALQKRYPANPSAFVTHYSSVELPDTAFAAAPRLISYDRRQSRVLFVGTLAQLYKAPDVLIEAVSLCVNQGVDLSLTMVGDGKYLPELEDRVKHLGLESRARFLGRLPAGEAVRTEMDKADLLVLPSRQEGLPRAMIEAMARGLPCIGSTVGGIPELLPPEDMVPPGDAEALAQKIREVVGDPARRQRMSARNLERVREYRADILQARRNEFYQYVRNVSLEYFRLRG